MIYAHPIVQNYNYTVIYQAYNFVKIQCNTCNIMHWLTFVLKCECGIYMYYVCNALPEDSAETNNK